jgi:uncharacterized protein
MNTSEIQERLKPQSDAIRRLGVAALNVFGSAARNEAHSGSDVDFLVRFDGPASYDRFMDLKFLLEGSLNVTVDLVTEDALRPEMRDAVEQDLQRVA